MTKTIKQPKSPSKNANSANDIIAESATSQQILYTIEPSTISQRIASKSIDIIISLICTIIFCAITILSFVIFILSSENGFARNSLANQILFWTIILTILTVIAITPALYTTFMLKRYQSTIGQRLFSLKVVSNNGKNITLRQCLIRAFGEYISILSIGWGYIFALKNKNNGQCIHCLISNTMVVKVAIIDKKEIEHEELSNN